MKKPKYKPATAGAMSVVFVKDEAVFTDSRQVADLFGNRHNNVLQDIDALLHSSEMRGEDSCWFQPVTLAHPTISGHVDRTFDLTRDGFTLLAMSWTGPKALDQLPPVAVKFNSRRWMRSAQPGDSLAISAKIASCTASIA